MDVLPYLKALSDETRLRLFAMLSHCELTVNEIVRVLEMGQSRVSRHLRILSDSGLLVSRRDGLWVHYTAAENPQTRNLSAAIGDLVAQEQQVQNDLSRSKMVLEDRSRSTRHFFNTIAGAWEDLKKSILGDFDLDAAVAEFFGRPETAVDVGCGTGDLLALLTESSEHVIGVDGSPGMLALARQRFEGRANVELRLGEAEHLPLKDSEADRAVMSMVLHHLSRPEVALREVARILRPGQAFVVADFFKHGNEMMREEYGDRWLGFEPSALRLWLEGSGFRVVEKRKIELKQALQLMIIVSRKNEEGS